MAVTEKDIRDALKKVKDPELNIDLVTLGLVYDILVDGSSAKAIISLTTPMCPVAGEIVDQARLAIAKVDGVEDAQVQSRSCPTPVTSLKTRNYCGSGWRITKKKPATRY